jgi:translation initiation factor 1
MANSKKRIDTNSSQNPLAGLKAAFSGFTLPDLTKIDDEQASSASHPPILSPTVSSDRAKTVEPLWKLGRVTLRRERAHRNGKSVIVVYDFATHLPDTVIEKTARKLRDRCACGGTVKNRSIEIQGDQPAKIRTVLEAEGYQVAGIG